MKTRQFYIFITAFCLAGWAWLLISYMIDNQGVSLTVCLSKQLTDMPCPSCGVTRSVKSFFSGEFYGAMVRYNPIGIVASLWLIVSPFWLLYDFFWKKKSYFNAYLWFEERMKKPIFYIPFFILIILNWIWNIYKEL